MQICNSSISPLIFCPPFSDSATKFLLKKTAKIYLTNKRFLQFHRFPIDLAFTPISFHTFLGVLTLIDIYNSANLALFSLLAANSFHSSAREEQSPPKSSKNKIKSNNSQFLLIWFRLALS